MAYAINDLIEQSIKYASNPLTLVPEVTRLAERLVGSDGVVFCTLTTA